MLESLARDLDVSSRLISECTTMTLGVLSNRTMEPEYRDRALLWEPKAEKVKKFSDEILKSVDSITAGLHIKKMKPVLDPLTVNRFFQQLLNYRQQVISVDSQFMDILKREGYLFRNITGTTPTEFWSAHFEGAGKGKQLAVLSKLKNQILVTQNRLVNFCYDQTGMLDGFGLYSSFSAIISQNTSVVSPGKEIEIIAGIASFTRTAQPVVSIDGKEVPVGEDAITRYTFNAPQKPGKYSHEVVIAFINQEGKKQKISKTVEYIVIALRK